MFKRLPKLTPIAVTLCLIAPGLQAASAQADFFASLTVQSIFVSGTSEPASVDVTGSRSAFPFDDFSEGNASTASMGSTPIEFPRPVAVGETLSIEWTVMAESAAPAGSAFIGDDPFLSIEIINTQDFAVDVTYVFETTLSGEANVDSTATDFSFAEAFATGQLDFNEPAFDLFNFAEAGAGSSGPPSFSESTGQIIVTTTLEPEQAAFADIFGGVAASAETIVPVPPAVWLFGSALIGLCSIRRRLRRR